MSKQDRQGVRTARDIEAKYDLSKLKKPQGGGSADIHVQQLTQALNQFMAETNAKFDENKVVFENKADLDEKGKLKSEQIPDEILKEVDLSEAVNTALAQAKASGEFKGEKGDKGDTGEKGADGTSVAITSVSESSVDGGSNVVTFSDGQTLTVKNGSKGSDGESGSGESIPSYVIEEAESTIAKVFSHGNYGRTIRFIAISDTHEDSAGTYNAQITVSNQHAGQAIKYIADRIGLDFVAHLGDASSRGAWTTTQEFDILLDDVKNINKFVFSGVRNTNNVFIPGNHDMMNLSGNQLLNSGASVLFGSICSGTKVRSGGWGYFDIEDAKVRVIYLNTSDSPISATYLGLTDAQKNWLCETLINVNTKDDAGEWGIILLSHAPLDFGNANISSNLLLPYVNGGTYGTYNFSNKNKAQILCNIHGHMHCYSYGYMNNKIRRFAVPNACFIGNNHYGTRTEYAAWADTSTYNKTANSGKDTSFSLVTIDLDSGRCYVDNYGAGIDRNFKTDYSSDIIPISISDITYNGSKTEESVLDKSKFSFTVAYNNGTTETVTGATSVSPTALVLGNNSVTITYVEDGVTLTGTITIVGEAKPAVNLLKLNRTYVAGTTDEYIYNNFDESKAYINTAYTTAQFWVEACTTSNVTETGLTVTEPNKGGICVAYPVNMPEKGTYRLSFDYASSGSYGARAHWRGVYPSGLATAYTVCSAAGSGHIDATITITNDFNRIVVFFGANTGGTATFSNVSLVKM